MRIDFDAATHTYKLDGQPVPSVTTILSPLSDFSFVSADVLERAKLFGTAVHSMVELYERQDLDEASLDEPLKRVLEQYCKAVRAKKWTVTDCELRVGHPRMKYAGTLDLLAETVAGTTCLIDIKTGTVPHTVGPQTAAYEAAYHAMHDGRAFKRYCLALTERDYKVVALNDLTDLSLFTSCLNIYRFKEQHNGNTAVAA